MPLPPDGLWSDLDPGLPIALVPLRLETRFGSREAVLDDGSTVAVPVLRVRIYPDDISVPTTPPGLTAVEQEAGSDFWATQGAPETAEEAAVPGSLEHRRRGAWEVLTRRVGSPRTAYVADRLEGVTGPVVAVSDYMRAVPLQIARWVPSEYHVLGADGFGFADTRPAARRFFHIDAQSVVVQALQALADAGEIDGVEVFVAPVLEGGSHDFGPLRGRGVSRMADATRLEGLEVARRGPDVWLRGDVPRPWRRPS